MSRGKHTAGCLASTGIGWSWAVLAFTPSRVSLMAIQDSVLGRELQINVGWSITPLWTIPLQPGLFVESMFNAVQGISVFQVLWMNSRERNHLRWVCQLGSLSTHCKRELPSDLRCCREVLCACAVGQEGADHREQREQ